MKKKTGLLLLSLVLLLPLAPRAGAEQSGRIRALQGRAETVVQQKNHFVTMVLEGYEIPFQVNPQGVVVRIQVNDRWQDVTAIEIVPVMETDAAGSRRLVAHELYFFTAEGILDITSDLVIRTDGR